MSHRVPPELDMLPDGRFRTPPRPPVATRVFIWAVLVAAVSAGLVGAFLALWVALTLLPIAIIAALVAWLALRFQIWRARSSASGQRNIRPR